MSISSDDRLSADFTLSDVAAHAAATSDGESTGRFDETASTLVGNRGRRARLNALLAQPSGAFIANRYHIHRLLGSGSMGAVYLARDEILQKDVALKFVHCDRVTREELRTEVELAQRVTHENVCRTYDLEEIDGELVVKMEYVDGETLAARLDRVERLSVDAALSLVRQVAAGLKVAHAQGVVHRDLKPENIFIEHKSGRVVLMDFGIARALDPRDPASRASAAGTPAYMSPEQVRNHDVDGRSDLYSLGCILFELLTGRVPYPASSAEGAMLRHLHDALPDVRWEQQDVPRRVARLVRRLLEKRPERRFPSAQALLRALAELARPRWPRRLAFGGALVLLFVVPWLHGRPAHVGRRGARPQTSWRPQIATRDLDYDQNGDTPVPSPDGQWLAYNSNRDGLFRLYLERVYDGVAHPLLLSGDFPGHPSWAPDSKSIYAPLDRSLLRIPLDGRPSMVLAPDVSEVAVCGRRLALLLVGPPSCPTCGHLVLRELDAHGELQAGERLLRQMRPEEQLAMLHCDAAGKNLVYVLRPRRPAIIRLGNVWLHPLDGRPPSELTHEQRDAEPVFVPDGRSLVVASLREGNLGLWELPLQSGQTGGAAQRLTVGELPHLPGGVSPDGKTLYFANDVTSIQLHVTQGSGQWRRIVHPRAVFGHIQVEPSGREVLAIATRGGERSALVAYPVMGGAERILAAAEDRGLAVTSDGREVVYVARDAERWRILAMPLEGGAPRQIAEADEPIDLTGIAGPISLSGLPMPAGEGSRGELFATRTSGTVQRAVRVPVTGGTLSDTGLEGWAVVRPAPVGGWMGVSRFAMAWGADWEMRLIAPGRPFDDPHAKVLRGRRFSWSPDGQSLYYRSQESLWRYAVATGTEERLFPLAEAWGGIAVSPDGLSIYAGQLHGQVHYQMITNFAERPRLQ